MNGLVLLAERGVPDQYEVTPGLLGFVVTFAVAIVFLFLVRSFNKNMRKVNLNERRRQEAAARAAEAEAGAETETEAAEDQPVGEAPDQAGAATGASDATPGTSEAGRTE